jgi:hypothetical protein
MLPVRTAEAGIVRSHNWDWNPSGVPIPISGGSGRVDSVPMRRSGSHQQLNEERFAWFLLAVNGLYIRATNARTGINDILDEVNKMEKRGDQCQRYAI